MNPIRYDGEIAVFTTLQVEILGEPGHYGYDRYIVIDGPPQYENAVNHWQQSFLVKKHRYSRIARFKTVVRNLFGETRSKADYVATAVLQAFLKPDSLSIYEDARKILKHYKLQKFYKMIPTLVYKTTQVRILTIPDTHKKDFSELLQEVYNRFIVFENLFLRVADKNRKYFPNLKFTALRILTGLGIENKFIPQLRTKRNAEDLEKFFIQMEKIIK